MKRKEIQETQIKVKEEKSFFTKSQIISSGKYSERKDVLNAILEENIQYTLEEVEKKIKEFMKGKVK